MVVDIVVKDRVKTIIIKDVLHVPKLKAKPFVGETLGLKRLLVQFNDEESFVMSPSREEVAIIHEVNGFLKSSYSKYVARNPWPRRN